MFSSTDEKVLRTTLDCIPIVMFAAQRQHEADQFRLLCVNRTHEDQSGLCNATIAGKRPSDFLPPNEADAVESRFDFCARKNKVIQYREMLHLTERQTHWSTILFPIEMQGSIQRIIGAAFALSAEGKFPDTLPLIENAVRELREAKPLSYLAIPYLAPAKQHAISTGSVVPLDGRRLL